MGAGTAMHMSDWVRACSWKEAGGRHLSDSTTLDRWQRWDQSENPQVSTNQSHCHFPETEGKEKKTDWSPAKTHFFENLFPNNRLSFGPARSAWAGLISNNPPAAL